MNIQEMHYTFRVLGQQLGIQLIRGILPESIDTLINSAIIEKVQEESLVGVHNSLQDSVGTQGQVMSPINSFKTLFKRARYKLDTNQVNANTGKIAYYNPLNGYYILNIPVINSDIKLDDNENKISPMFFTRFSLEYEDTMIGNAVSCRIIGRDRLDETLNDYCNNASKDFPIVCISSNDNENNQEQIEIFSNTKKANIKFINIYYIKTPNVVKYNKDLSQCVNCDLPEYTHHNIVERAVNKYNMIVGNTSDRNNNRQQ